MASTIIGSSAVALYGQASAFSGSVTTRYAGESATGLLAFQPPDPVACTTPTGTTTAAISGVLGLSSP